MNTGTQPYINFYRYKFLLEFKNFDDYMFYEGIFLYFYGILE